MGQGPVWSLRVGAGITMADERVARNPELRRSTACRATADALEAGHGQRVEAMHPYHRFTLITVT